VGTLGTRGGRGQGMEQPLNGCDAILRLVREVCIALRELLRRPAARGPTSRSERTRVRVPCCAQSLSLSRVPCCAQSLSLSLGAAGEGAPPQRRCRGEP
jgi:hypothetical protein